VLEQPLHAVAQARGQLQGDGALGHQDPHHRQEMTLGVHEGGPAALAGSTPQHVVAQQALEELLAQRPRDVEEGARAQVDDRRVLAGARVGQAGLEHALSVQ
jgi:hypothetical protein